MTDGNIKIDEVDRFINLSESELYTLRSIYLKRLNHINTEIRRRHKEEDLGQICIDMMSRYGHCDGILSEDAIRIIDMFDRQTSWRLKNRKVSNETLSLATLSVIYDKYGIECDPYDLVDLYSLDNKQFYVLNQRLHQWADINYWR